MWATLRPALRRGGRPLLGKRRDRGSMHAPPRMCGKNIGGIYAKPSALLVLMCALGFDGATARINLTASSRHILVQQRPRW